MAIKDDLTIPSEYMLLVCPPKYQLPNKYKPGCTDKKKTRTRLLAICPVQEWIYIQEVTISTQREYLGAQENSNACFLIARTAQLKNADYAFDISGELVQDLSVYETSS